MDLQNRAFHQQNYSNFRLFGIGELSESQKRNRESGKGIIGAFDKAKDKFQTAADKAKADLKNINSFKDAFTLFASKTSKFNPAAAIPRAAALALVRLNWMGIARKLRPAVLSESELKAKNYDLANAAIVKAVWDKNIKEYWTVLGGDMSALKKAVEQGFNKPVFKTKKIQAAKKKESGFSNCNGGECKCNGCSGCDGGACKCLSPLNKFANQFDFSVEESKYNQYAGHSNACEGSCVASLIGAGGAIVIAAINAISKKAGAKDDPFVGGQANDPSLSFPPFTSSDTDVLKAIEIAALEDRRKHGLDPGTYEAEAAAIEEKYDTMWGMPKPLFYTVVVLGTGAILFGGYKLIKHLNKPVRATGSRPQ